MGYISTINRTIEKQAMLDSSVPTPGYPQFYYILGANLGSLLHGGVSVMSIFYCSPISLKPCSLLKVAYPHVPRNLLVGFMKVFVCLCWGLTSQSTIFQSCRDGATASWVINQYFRGVKCLAQGHNTAAVGIEPPTSRSGVLHSTTEPPRSPSGKCVGSCHLLILEVILPVWLESYLREAFLLLKMEEFELPSWFILYSMWCLLHDRFALPHTWKQTF